VAFQGVLGDLVNNQVPPLFRIYPSDLYFVGGKKGT
jgi:hypothetical protein